MEKNNVTSFVPKDKKNGIKCQSVVQWYLSLPHILSEIQNNSTKKIGVLTLNTSFKSEKITSEIILSETGNLKEATSKLYDALHQLDHQNLDVILVEKMPDFGLGKSMNDRLQRAASNN